MSVAFEVISDWKLYKSDLWAPRILTLNAINSKMRSILSNYKSWCKHGNACKHKFRDTFVLYQIITYQVSLQRKESTFFFLFFFWKVDVYSLLRRWTSTVLSPSANLEVERPVVVSRVGAAFYTSLSFTVNKDQ